MCTAFGYFEDQADDKRVLANIYCSLRKGGTLIMDMEARLQFTYPSINKFIYCYSIIR